MTAIRSVPLPRAAATVLALGIVVFATLGIDRAEAGTWATGTYAGKLFAKGTDRPKTKIKLKITERKIKLLSAEFVLECDGDRKTVETKVGGGRAGLNQGPAGAGFAIYESDRRRGAGYQQNYDLVGGVKGDVVKGQASMQRIYDRPYESCIDEITLHFKAKRR